MQVTEIDIKMTWGSLRAQIFGQITPNSRPIIGLHGYLDNSNSMKPLAEYLTASKEYYVISVDLPGHGFR
jgi:pimeloyl-ACP methyl ester carboxylesterase